MMKNTLRTQEARNSRTLGLGLVICVLGLAVFAAAGCQESERGADAGSGDVMRRAQLVGHENIQLKRQVAELEKQIEALTKELEAQEAENLRTQTEHADVYADLFNVLAECQKELEKYQTEGAR